MESIHYQGKSRADLYNSHLVCLEQLFYSVTKNSTREDKLKRDEFSEILARLRKFSRVECPKKVTKSCLRDVNLFLQIEQNPELLCCNECNEFLKTHGEIESSYINGPENEPDENIDQVDNVENANNDENNSDYNNDLVNNGDVAIAPVHKILQSDSQVVSIIVYDVNTIVTGHAFGEINIWNIDSNSGSIFTAKKHKGGVYSMIILNNSTFVTGDVSSNGIGIIWQIEREDMPNKSNQSLNEEKQSENLIENVAQIKVAKKLFDDLNSESNQSKVRVTTINETKIKLTKLKSIMFKNKGIFTICHFKETLVFCGMRNGSIFVWDIANNKALQKLNNHKGPVLCLCYNKNKLFSGSDDRKIICIDTQDIKPDSNQFDVEHTHYVLSITAIREDETIVSGSYDQFIKIWKYGISQSLKTIHIHNGFIYSLIFDFDNDLLISGSEDKTIRFTELKFKGLPEQKEKLPVEKKDFSNSYDFNTQYSFSLRDSFSRIAFMKDYDKFASIDFAKVTITIYSKEAAIRETQRINEVLSVKGKTCNSDGVKSLKDLDKISISSKGAQSHKPLNKKKLDKL